MKMQTNFVLIAITLAAMSCSQNTTMPTSGSSNMRPSNTPAQQQANPKNTDASGANTANTDGGSTQKDTASGTADRSNSDGQSSNPSDQGQSGEGTTGTSPTPTPSASPTSTPNPSGTSPTPIPTPTPATTTVEISGGSPASTDDLAACAAEFNVSSDQVNSFSGSGVFNLTEIGIYAMRVSGNTVVSILQGAGKVAGLCLFMGGNARFTLEGSLSIGNLHVDNRGSSLSVIDLTATSLEKGSAILGGNSTLQVIASETVCSSIKASYTGSSKYSCSR